jgi:serine/threonine protein kinase
VYGEEVQRDHIYVVSDYYEGGSLFHHIIEEGVIEENDAKQFTKNILFALKHLHEQVDVAVGNLNPESIVIDSNVGKFHTKLINFTHCIDLNPKTIYSVE